MLALVDCDSFYVSCERAFNHRLIGQPVVVLSNNDGNIVARSREAKAMGISMAAPFFELKETLQSANCHVFSSNYTLYADMSARVMTTLARFVEEVEVYSIDEAFLNLNGYQGLYPDLTAFARKVRQTVLKLTRIPVSIGIAPTKTLCKVASHLAKKNPDYQGVCVLASDQPIAAALRALEVEEVWGIGSRYARKLKQNGIKTAWDLRQAPDEWLLSELTVNGLRLAHELRGFPCKMLELEPKPKKSICVAPSFGRVIPNLATIQAALTTHVSRAAEKLRKQGSAAGTVTVFIHTNRFRRNRNGEAAKPYYKSRTVELPHPSQHTSELVRYAIAALDSIFAFGYQFQKVGLILNNLVPSDHRQYDLYRSAPDERLTTLMERIDQLNYRYGRDTVRLASAGYDSSWQIRRNFLSPCYTTRWKEILRVF